jgi:glycine dehydrogenase
MQSAVMAGLKVVPVKSLQDGSLDLVDLKEKAEKHSNNLAAFMVRLVESHVPFHDRLIDPLDHLSVHIRRLRRRRP